MKDYYNCYLGFIMHVMYCEWFHFVQHSDKYFSQKSITLYLLQYVCLSFTWQGSLKYEAW